MGAKKKPLETVSTGDAEIDPGKVGAEGSNVQCGDFKAPPSKSAGKIIEDEDTDDTVQQIIAWLDERKLLA
jgi:electron transfer flavoprotein beta subunit